MKKTLVVLFFSFLLVVLAACNGGDKKPNENTNTNETPGDEVTFDGNGAKFIIMANDPKTADPRLETYAGLYQREKQERIEYVEEKYNVEIVFTNYPSNASWGESRDNFIIQDVISGGKSAHVYQTSSVSIPILATAGAILPLNDYIEKYGSPDFYPLKKEFGKFLDKYYVYDDHYPVNDNGIYYNQELLQDLGYEPDYPTKLWHDGEWTWSKFRELVMELNDKLDHEQGQYPIGGKTYEWYLQLLHANGGFAINNQLEIGITSQESIQTLELIGELYNQPGMWIDDADPWNTVQQGFRDGKIVFHNGQAWNVTAESKFGKRSFNKIGYVPFPVGPNTKEDLSNFGNINLFGPASYVISNAYDISTVPKGYEHMVLHSEIIFQIWADLQYFGTLDDYMIDYGIDLLKYYADESSVDAHLSVATKNQSEILYGFGAASSGLHAESFIMLIQSAAHNRNARATLESMKPMIIQQIKERYKVDIEDDEA